MNGDATDVGLKEGSRVVSQRMDGMDGWRYGIEGRANGMGWDFVITVCGRRRMGMRLYITYL